MPHPNFRAMQFNLQTFPDIPLYIANDKMGLLNLPIGKQMRQGWPEVTVQALF